MKKDIWWTLVWPHKIGIKHTWIILELYIKSEITVAQYRVTVRVNEDIQITFLEGKGYSETD